MAYLETLGGRPRDALMADAVACEAKLGKPILWTSPRTLQAETWFWSGDLAAARAQFEAVRDDAARTGTEDAPPVLDVRPRAGGHASPAISPSPRRWCEDGIEAARDAEDPGPSGCCCTRASLVDAWRGRERAGARRRPAAARGGRGEGRAARRRARPRRARVPGAVRGRRRDGGARARRGRASCSTRWATATPARSPCSPTRSRRSRAAAARTTRRRCSPASSARRARSRARGRSPAAERARGTLALARGDPDDARRPAAIRRRRVRSARLRPGRGARDPARTAAPCCAPAGAGRRGRRARRRPPPLRRAWARRCGRRAPPRSSSARRPVARAAS